jgi:hypothetical protein
MKNYSTTTTNIGASSILQFVRHSRWQMMEFSGVAQITCNFVFSLLIYISIYFFLSSKVYRV